MYKKIYKICLKEEWIEAKRLNVFLGSKIDKRDGFIHLSSGNQVHETARLHFREQEDLMLLEVKAQELNIKWETSRGNRLFPHLYGSLPLNQVSREHNLVLDKNKNHVFPSWLDVT